ncbi:hypothetical protein [Amycolatopsis azurea]|uniref:Uncharacterized protein n=1 Tax=Amycolatopsis azurea DSM 43854 TaxID=1238180 RepID=A0ABX3JB84_9PSEU|nr:hypothetical protein [Amycolatopsis azurea]OOC04262.1 hypothetical protein B0293_23685 [Amycolatopsis azurea DSM 43854]
MSTRSHLSVAGGDGERRPARRRKTDTAVTSGYDYPRNPLLQYTPGPDNTNCPACAWLKLEACPHHLAWQAAADYYGHPAETAPDPTDYPTSPPAFEVDQPLLLRGTLHCVVARREWTAVGWVYLVALHPRGTPASAREVEFTALPPGEDHDTMKGTRT